MDGLECWKTLTAEIHAPSYVLQTPRGAIGSKQFARFVVNNTRKIHVVSWCFTPCRFKVAASTDGKAPHERKVLRTRIRISRSVLIKNFIKACIIRHSGILLNHFARKKHVVCFTRRYRLALADTAAWTERRHTSRRFFDRALSVLINSCMMAFIIRCSSILLNTFAKRQNLDLCC